MWLFIYVYFFVLIFFPETYKFFFLVYLIRISFLGYTYEHFYQRLYSSDINIYIYIIYICIISLSTHCKYVMYSYFVYYDIISFWWQTSIQTFHYCIKVPIIYLMVYKEHIIWCRRIIYLLLPISVVKEKWPWPLTALKVTRAIQAP